MKRLRVTGYMQVKIETVIEVEEDEELEDFKIFEKALDEFEGVQNYCGFGDCDHLIGVSGEDDTIRPDSDVEFTEYEEE